MRKPTTFLLMAIAAGALGGSAYAQNAPTANSSSRPSPGASDLKVENEIPSDPLFDLKVAVRALRQASVMLISPEASKQPGPAREKAFEAAQDAIFKVQKAMTQLPRAYHAGQERDAKEWPAIAARIDTASTAIEKSLSDLEKDHTKPNAKALNDLNGALGDAEKALRALPEWRVGADQKGT